MTPCHTIRSRISPTSAASHPVLTSSPSTRTFLPPHWPNWSACCANRQTSSTTPVRAPGLGQPCLRTAQATGGPQGAAHPVQGRVSGSHRRHRRASPRPGHGGRYAGTACAGRQASRTGFDGRPTQPLVSGSAHVAESGYPDFDAVSWTGLSAPAGLPDAIRDRLSEATRAALTDAEVIKPLKATGTPSPFAARRISRRLSQANSKVGGGCQNRRVEDGLMPVWRRNALGLLPSLDRDAKTPRPSPP
ncbi:hypothetical protein CTI14_13040 [Methylobacterium radiotolerans]|nr:hypothetical protein CTI14_13040 [Methylobacterium radiotolerans]